MNNSERQSALPPAPGSVMWMPKQDDRPQRGWWAPGEYLNLCRRCNKYFVGDKRAGICADCAYESKAETIFMEKKTSKTNRALAAKIAADLFTSGDGKRANRLHFILESGEVWGGWSEPAAATLIEKALNSPNNVQTKT